MARKKVKLSLIMNDSVRKSTYRKRSKGLVKKVSELSTLCGVDAAVVAMNPGSSQPDVWPTASEAVSILQKFRDLPEVDQHKKTMNQETYYRNKIEKLNEQAKKMGRVNGGIHLETLLYQCLVGQSLEAVEVQELGDLSMMIEEKLKEAEERLKQLKLVQVLQPVQLRPSAVQEGNGGKDNRGWPGLPPTVEALKGQTWFMEAMDNPDQHVGESSGSGGAGGGANDDLFNIDGFSGDT